METIRFAIASAADSQEITRLLATVFSESEPPAVAVGLSSADMEKFLGLIVPAMLAQELTITARDENGHLAGALLTEDLGSFPEFDHSEVSPRMRPIMAMLNQLEEEYLAGKAVHRGEYIHLLMLAVEPSYSGCGIAKSLVAKCLKNGATKEYRTAVTEATGNVSQHIFHKHGFLDRVSISYQDFLFEGQPPFSTIREHRGAILMDRKLS